MIIFDGMTSDEILDALCKMLNLPYGTLLICRNGDGIEVPLTSKMPDGYMVHVQLRAALQDISTEIISSLSIWESSENHSKAVQVDKKKLNKIKCIVDWPHFARTSMGISDEGNLHRWTLKIVGALYIYNHIGISPDEQYRNPRTSLLPGIEIRNGSFQQRYDYIIEVILDLRIPSRADGHNQRGLWLKIADACIYHSPLFGQKPSAQKPWFLCIWNKSTNMTAKILKYERDIPIALGGAHKVATHDKFEYVNVPAELLD